MSTPKKLLALANKEPARPVHKCLSEYAEAIHTLRTKGFTWREIKEWLAANGLPYSTGQIMNVAKKRRGS